MAYSLKQAAEATGKSKPTILRAIQSGKISAKKDDHNEWLIDPAELHRVYEPVTRNDTRTVVERNDEIPNETASLRREVEIRDERLIAIEAERERERLTLQETIADLRRRLDAEAEERRKLTMLLTDQRKAELEPVPAAPEKPTGGRLARAWSVLRGKG